MMARFERALFAAFLMTAVAVVPIRAQAMRTVEYAARFDARGSLRVWNMAGSIRVTGWDYDSVIVRGSVPSDQRFICGGGNTGMKCAVDVPPRDDGKEPGSSLEVFVPRRAQLWIKSSSADIIVSEFNGSLDAYSVSGSIRVEGDAQAVALESMAGPLDVRASAATLRAKTASGDVRITGTAEDAQATSVSGNIIVSASRILRGRFESIEGNTTWLGDVMPRAMLEFSSHAGNIELHLPPATGADVSINSFEGSFRSDFAVAERARRDTKGRELRFTLPGDHGASITIRNFKGDVRLLRH